MRQPGPMPAQIIGRTQQIIAVPGSSSQRYGFFMHWNNRRKSRIGYFQSFEYL